MLKLNVFELLWRILCPNTTSLLAENTRGEEGGEEEKGAGKETTTGGGEEEAARGGETQTEGGGEAEEIVRQRHQNQGDAPLRNSSVHCWCNGATTQFVSAHPAPEEE